VSKFADGLPLHRQSVIYARQGVDLDRSTMADWMGSAAALLRPLVEAIRQHVCTGPVLHADDTTVPVLAPGLGRTKTGRLWAVVRDERTWAGAAPPAAFYCYSPDRRGERAEALLGQCRGFLHADGYGGFNSLYVREPKTGRPRLTEVACWAHYLEHIFMWIRCHHRQHPPMTAVRQTPHKNRSQSERLEKGEEVRLGLPWLGVCWLYP
jgi:transposase